MAIGISSKTYNDLVTHASDAGDAECCGILFGEGDMIQSAKASTNVADDPRRNFEIEPSILIAAEKDMRSGGRSILGYYHSHPNGRCEPSPRDASDAAPDGRLWAIIALEEISIWRAVPNGHHHGRFTQEKLQLLPLRP